jgi:hypothetical protein
MLVERVLAWALSSGPVLLLDGMDRWNFYNRFMMFSFEHQRHQQANTKLVTMEPKRKL